MHEPWWRHRRGQPVIEYASRLLLVTFLPLAVWLFFWPDGNVMGHINATLFRWLHYYYVLPASVNGYDTEQFFNFTAFGALALLVRLAWEAPRSRELVIFGVTLALSIEVIQLYFITNRHFDWMDFIFTSLGCVAGVLAGHWIRAHLMRPNE